MTFRSRHKMLHALRRAVAVTSRLVLEQPQPLAVVALGDTVAYRYGDDIKDLPYRTPVVFVMTAERVRKGPRLRWEPRMHPYNKQLLGEAYANRDRR